MTGIEALHRLNASEAEKERVVEEILRFVLRISRGVAASVLDQDQLRQRISLSQIDLEDIAVDATHRILLSLTEQTESVEAWAHGVVRIVIHERLRADRPGECEALTDEVEAAPTAPNSIIENATDHDKRLFIATVEAVAELPEEQMTALLLHDHECLEYPEVAERCGAKPGAIRQRVHRARRSIKAAVARIQIEANGPRQRADAGAAERLDFEVRFAQAALDEMIDRLPDASTPKKESKLPEPRAPEVAG